MIKQGIIRIESEIGDSQTAKAIAITNFSAVFAQRLEEILYKRQKYTEEKLQQLLSNLNSNDLSPKNIAEIWKKIVQLQNSRTIEAVSLLIDNSFKHEQLKKPQLDSFYNIAYCDRVEMDSGTNDSIDVSNDEDSIFPPISSWTFEVEYDNDDFHWRAFSTKFIRNKVPNNNFLEKELKIEKPEDQCPRGINKDALAYFQNCPIPPGTLTNDLEEVTQIGPYMLTNGCLVSITKKTCLKQNGGIKWKKSKKLLPNAENPYGTLQMKFHGKLNSFSINYPDFSKSTKNSQKWLFQILSASKHQLLQVITQPQFPSFVFCLHLSLHKTKINKLICKGDMN